MMIEAERSETEYPKQSSTIASVSAGSIALLIFGIQPLLYSALVREGLASADLLGLLSATEVVAIAIGSGLAIPWLKRRNVSEIAIAAILLIGAANLFQVYFGTASTLFIARAAAGLGSGFLVGIAGYAIAATNRVGQWAAGYLLGQAISQFLLVQGFTAFQPTASAADLQFALAMFSLALFVIVPFLPLRLAAEPAIVDASAIEGRPTLAGLLWLLIMFLFVGGAITIWAYAGLWLEGEGLRPDRLGILLSSCLAGQVAGALIASAVPNGPRDRLRLAATTALLVASVVAWLQWPSWWLPAASFGIWWMSAVPVLSSILGSIDPERRSLPYAPAAQLAGVAAIPTLAGALFAETDLSSVLLCGCGAVALALLLNLIRPPTPKGGQ